MGDYNGIYTGIVVDNTGVREPCEVPSGKVLVHIDGVTPTNLRSQSYKGLPASDVKGTLDVETTKKFQVLAKVLMPIVNESSPGIFNANDNTNKPTRAVPANQYSQFNDAARDKFSDQVDNVVRKNNTYGHSYTSDYRSTGGMGVFAVPEPGTRVRIMFENGNLASPIVIGQVNTSDEFAAVYKSGDTYPTLPKAAQNYFKSSSENGSSESESHTAKGGDTELNSVEKFQSLADERVSITQRLAQGNLSESQKASLLARGEAIGNQQVQLSNSANDSDLKQMGNIMANQLEAVADIID